MTNKKKAGLFKRAVSFVKRRYNILKYKNIEYYELKLKSLDVKYSTNDSYSKNWFYPRYDNGRYHEPVATHLFIDEIKQDYCVFDIGTNLGFFACISGLLASKGTVHAFEVDENCISIIEKNCVINHLTNITINNFAVSDNDSTEKIPFSTKPNPRLKVSNNGAPNFRYKEVTAIRIDSYIDQKKVNPDFIKIDVEGAELKVLKGMNKVLQQPKLKLLIEVHVPNLKEFFNTDYKDILELLVKNGFTIKELTAHRKDQSDFREININSELQGNTMIFAYKL